MMGGKYFNGSLLPIFQFTKLELTNWLYIRLRPTYSRILLSKNEMAETGDSAVIDWKKIPFIIKNAYFEID